MRAAHPLLTLVLLVLACVAHAQSAPGTGKETKTPPSAAASPDTSEPAKPADGKDNTTEPGTKGAGETKPTDSPDAAPPPTDGKPAESGAAAEAAPTPAVDIGLIGREGELVPQLPRLLGEEEVTWLEAEGQRFFVFKRAPKPDKTVRGTLVIVPPPQAFIDQRPVTRALRDDPPAGGYHTFALQPALAKDAVPMAKEANGTAEKALSDKPTEADPTKPADGGSAPSEAPSADQPEGARARALCPRLKATIAAAGLVEPRSVALVAEQQHIPVVLGCFADGLPPEVHAFVAIGGWQGEWPKLTVPSLEFLPVLDPVARREAARRARTPPPAGAAPRKQVEIDGRLDDAALEIARRLRGWLDRLPAPTAPEAGKPKTVSG